MLKINCHSQNLITVRVDKPLKEHQVATVGSWSLTAHWIFLNFPRFSWVSCFRDITSSLDDLTDKESNMTTTRPQEQHSPDFGIVATVGIAIYGAWPDGCNLIQAGNLCCMSYPSLAPCFMSACHLSWSNMSKKHRNCSLCDAQWPKKVYFP